MAGRSWRGGRWQDDDGEGEHGRMMMERGKRWQEDHGEGEEKAGRSWRGGRDGRKIMEQTLSGVEGRRKSKAMSNSAVSPSPLRVSARND